MIQTVQATPPDSLLGSQGRLWLLLDPYVHAGAIGDPFASASIAVEPAYQGNVVVEPAYQGNVSV